MPFIDKKAISFLFFLLFSVFMRPGASASAQQPADSQRLFSPSTAEKFYEIGHELSRSEQLGNRQIHQALIFLRASASLDKGAVYIYPDMIRLISRLNWTLPAGQSGPNIQQQAYDEMVYDLLNSYVNESSDLELTKTAIRYLLDRFDSREEREQLLSRLLRSFNGRNAALESELATLLGLLTAEKADTESAISYLMVAYDKNKYNRLAFAKLAELIGEQISVAAWLEHLRAMLVEDPLDIDAAITMAELARSLQLYEMASRSYQYSAELYSYLYPDTPLPASIYIPWAVCSYNWERNQHKVLLIAEQIRQSGRFDLVLESIAAKAAEKTQDHQKAQQILDQAEHKAIERALVSHQPADYEKLAWFYSFARQDADMALDWANKAYSAEPNSATSAGLLAYALVLNEQTDWAKLLIDNYPNNPPARLAMAQIQLQSDQRDSAIEGLKSVITATPGSLMAEQAQKLLGENDAEYVPAVEPEVILATLKGDFDYAPVPKFVEPGRAISARLSLRGTEFSYASNFAATVSITNNSLQPIVISDSSFFKGDIRIDARISGDLDLNIPNLVSLRIGPSSPLEPGSSFVVPVRLYTARLRQVLAASPQAFLEIKFTVILDPAGAPGFEQAEVTVKRPGVKLDTSFLQNRLNSISKGRQGQKLQACRLFAGLLKEQYQLAGGEPLYKMMYADWMPQMLKSAIVSSLTGDDWVVRVHTMTDILSLPGDYELINAVSENLNDKDHWPARLMALYLLKQNQKEKFSKVLDWAAEYDSNELVREMAVALGASTAEKQ